MTAPDPRGPLRTIKSATYTPMADRTDTVPGGRYGGDTVYIRYEECDHLGHGNPTMQHKVGSRVHCFRCGQEQS